MGSKGSSWAHARLEDLCVPGGLVRGPFGGSLKKSEFVSSGYQVYEQRHAIDGPAATARYFVNSRKFAAMKRFAVWPGDFLVSCSGTIGRISRVPEGAPKGIINQALLKITVDESVVDPRYFGNYFRWGTFQDRILDSTQGGAMQNLVGMPIFRSIPIAFPMRDEQSRIASALEDVGAQTEQLKRLIAKKEAIKQGMMQQLLTGRTRLPGFTDSWTERTLSEIATVDPGALPGGTSRNLLIDYISLEDVERGQLLGSSRVAFGDAPSRARRVVEMYDVLFGTVRPNLQSHLLYAGELRRPIASTGFAVVRTNSSSDPTFVFNLLMCDLTTIQIDRIIAGSNYPAVSSGDVRRLAFLVPTLEEQRAIAAALSDAESEIAALRARLGKTRDVKAGMMQQLLTGRTRLLGEVAA